MPFVDQDQEHLRILSIAWYIMAGMVAFFSLFGLVYVAIGVIFSFNPPPTSKPGDEAAKYIGPIFAILGGLFTSIGGAFAVCAFLTGRYLALKRHKVFCLVIAGINCMYVPIGTALGVFTIMVLQRPSVRHVFEGTAGLPPLPKPPDAIH